MLEVAIRTHYFINEGLRRTRETLGREDGQGTVEYVGAVIAAASIVLVLIGSASTIGGTLRDALTGTVSQFTTAAAQSGANGEGGGGDKGDEGVIPDEIPGIGDLF